MSAEQVLGGKGVDIALSATLRFPDDVLAQFDCGLSIGHRHEPRGDRRGGLALRRRSVARPRAGDRADARRRGRAIEVAPANPYTHELENFARAVRGEEPPLLGAEDALGQARTIEALYASAESGRSVALEA